MQAKSSSHSIIMLRTPRHRRGDSITELDLIEKRGLDGPIRISEQDLTRQQQQPRQYEFHSRLTGETLGVSGYGLVIIAFGLFTCVLAVFACRAVLGLFYL